MDVDKNYIDKEDALKRVGGNEALYIKLLKQFIAGGHVDSLEKVLADNDLEAAAHSAHTIKGIAANLSLPKLTAAAIELEQCIKNGGDYASCFSQLKEIYDVTSLQVAGITG